MSQVYDPNNPKPHGIPDKPSPGDKQLPPIKNQSLLNTEDKPPENELPVEPIDPNGPGAEVVTDPDPGTTTPPDGSDPNTPTDSFIPEDFSGEADAIQGDGDMSYEVPEAGDAFIPESSGTGVEPTQTNWDVTREQTVAGQLEDLYDRDSPFFEQARQRAIRSHLSSGGQNSAMAGAAGELAAMDTAFKVGFADAATYARSAEFNAAMANQFSLAEQRFIQNALLSEQNFQQSKALQTQRIAAQMESIILDYKGRNQLMDKELDQFFLKAKQDHEYKLDMLYESTDMQMSLNNMMQLSNFFIASFGSVMEAANNPNLTPEQSAAAMQQGMAYANQQWNFLADFLVSYRSGANSDWAWMGNTNPGDQWWNYSNGTPTFGGAGNPALVPSGGGLGDVGGVTG